MTNWSVIKIRDSFIFPQHAKLKHIRLQDSREFPQWRKRDTIFWTLYRICCICVCFFCNKMSSHFHYVNMRWVDDQRCPEPLIPPLPISLFLIIIICPPLSYISLSLSLFFRSQRSLIEIEGGAQPWEIKNDPLIWDRFENTGSFSLSLISALSICQNSFESSTEETWPASLILNNYKMIHSDRIFVNITNLVTGWSM